MKRYSRPTLLSNFLSSEIPSYSGATSVGENENCVPIVVRRRCQKGSLVFSLVRLFSCTKFPLFVYVRERGKDFLGLK